MSFPANSRYATVAIEVTTHPDGHRTACLLRRFSPPPETMAVQRRHAVVEGDRLDTLAAVHVGDPELSWRIADANRAMRPASLVAVVGRVLTIPLPDGVPGRSGV